MKYAKWRPILVILILAVYFGLYLADGQGWIMPRRAAIAIQATPAFTFIGKPLAVLAVFLIASCLFGRVYCSLLCPAGHLQDLFTRIGRRLNLSRLRPTKPGAPALLLLLIAAATIAGLNGVANAFDPIGLFGRFALPIGEYGRRWFGGVGELTSYDATTTLAAIAGVFLLVVLPLFLGRWFCDRLCPVGALLGFAARTNLGRRLAISSDKCVSCGKCGAVCPTRCADPTEKTIDPSRCVECLDCVSACRFSAISFQRPEPSGRRGFLHSSLAAAAGLAYIFSRELSGRTAKAADPDFADQSAIRIAPPGSGGDQPHRQRCISCQACVLACPVGIIRPSGPDLRPTLDYDYGYCQYNCTECSRSCPAKAFHPVDEPEKHRIRVAKTSLALSRCIVPAQGTECGACAEVCPTHAVSMASQGEGLPTIPDFDADYCIGCGACYHVCPAEPRAFTLIGLEKHETSLGVRSFGSHSPEEEPRENSEEEQEGPTDFPF